MNKKNKIILNIFVSTITQFITLMLGLILPRIILVSWGSEYNGLINSVTTIMRYLVLLEAGINTSTLQALYKAIGNKNDYEISVIVRSSQKYYRKVSIIYALLVVLIAFIYPLLINTTIHYWEIVSVIVLQGCSGVINFAFRASYQQVINADGKYYIISLVTLFTTISTYIVKIISIRVFDSIIIMQLLGVVVMLIQILFYEIYFRKKYQWINKSVLCDMKLLENRKYYVIQQIAGLVFNSTDVLVLSIFCGLKVASVYTIYNMIFASLTTVIGIVRSSTNFVLGQSFHENKKRFVDIYKIYSSLQTMLGAILTSTCIIMILSFIRLYTDGISDIDYNNYSAAILFSMNIIFECSRGASLAGANVAGQAPKTTWRYVVEAFINLSVSLLLVKPMGIIGVLVGTLIAGLWRTIDSILYFYKNVLNEKPQKEILYIIINLLMFLLFAYVGKQELVHIVSYTDFVVWGVVILCGITISYSLMFFVVYWKNTKQIIYLLKKK